MRSLGAWLAGDGDTDPGDEARKARIGARQLERVEDYLVATLNLELVDPEVRLAIHRIRGEVLAVRDMLVRPRPVRW